MAKWCAMVGLVLWVAGTIAIAHALWWRVVSEPVSLPLPDGTIVRGTLYRPREDAPRKLAAVVLAHGAGVAGQSCLPGLAVPFARSGYLALAVDAPGHGASDGYYPRSGLDPSLATVSTVAAHPELDAAIDFLTRHPLYARTFYHWNGHENERLALVGHSLGGWAAANVGYQRRDVHAVVSIGVAPEVSAPRRPQNFLMVTGGLDELCPTTKCAVALARATDGLTAETGKVSGEFWDGSARYLVKISNVTHLTEAASPAISLLALGWTNTALEVVNQDDACEGLPLVMSAVPVATGGGLAAAAWLLAFLARGLGPTQEAQTPDCRWGRWLAFLCLAVAAVPAVGAVARGLDIGPVYFAVPALTLTAVVAVVCRAAAGRPRRNALPTPTTAGLGRGLGIGMAALLLGFAWFGGPWGMTWLSLLPNARRLLLALALFALAFPWSFLLAQGHQQLLGDGSVRRWGILLRATTWLAIPLALWFGYCILTVAHCALFVIPVALLAVSFLIPLPLWLLRDREGMALARAVSHAGATAWLLACHLPFVHGS